MKIKEGMKVVLNELPDAQIYNVESIDGRRVEINYMLSNGIKSKSQFLDVSLVKPLKIPSDENLAKAQNEYLATETRDFIITPFLNAVEAEGWKVKRNENGCAELNECQKCSRKYVHTFIKNCEEIKLCPHCRAYQFMLDKVTPENTHPETDWGDPVGKEEW